MKKLIALMLCLLMVLSMAACGGKKENKTADAPVVDDETEVVVDETVEEEVVEEEVIEEEVVEETVEQTDGSPVGVCDGGYYENTFFGIGCELGSDWIISSEEELAEMVGLTADMLDNESYQDVLKNADMFFDLYAMSGTSTINITVENLGALYGEILSEDEYMDLAIQNVEMMLPSAGYEDMVIEKTTTQIGDKSYKGIAMESTYQGIAMYQRNFIVKVGEYVAAVTVTSAMEDETMDLMGYFFSLT